MVGPIDVKRKGSASVRYLAQYVILTFDLTHDLDLGCFKVKFRNNSFSGIVGLIDVKWKRSELIWYWADCMTLPFDHTHDFDLGVEISRSESEITLSQEWDGRLTWNEKDVSHPFMTMILTSVTMVGCADVPDSDWGDFRRRRAIDISSFTCPRLPGNGICWALIHIIWHSLSWYNPWLCPVFGIIILTLYTLNCFKDCKRYTCIVCHSLDCVQKKKTKFTMEQPNMLPILYCQYHAYWCPGNLRSQGISRHGIGQISQNILPLASEELIIEALAKWLTFCRQHFQKHFHEQNLL